MDKEKETASQLILQKLHKNKTGFAFGGYYRDLLSSKDFVDVDFWVFDDKRPEALRLIKDLGYEAVEREEIVVRVDGKINHIKKNYLIKSKEGKELFVLDFMYAQGKKSPFDVLPIDADINCMYVDLDENKIAAGNGFSLGDIVANITNQVFKPCEDLTKTRSDYLKTKGYHSKDREVVFSKKNIEYRFSDSIPAPGKEYDDAVHNDDLDVKPEINIEPKSAPIKVRFPIKEEETKEEGIKMAEATTAAVKKPASMDEFVKKAFAQGKHVANEAAYRSAGKLLVKTVKDGLIKLIQSKGGDDMSLAIVAGFLDTEAGEALIGIFLGSVAPMIPGVDKYPQALKLSNEVQIESASKAMTFVFSEASQFILPGVMEVIAGLPKETLEEGARVEEHKEEVEEEEESKEEVKAKKKAASDKKI